MTVLLDQIRIDVSTPFTLKRTPGDEIAIAAGQYVAVRCDPDDNGRYAKLYHWTNGLKGEFVLQVALSMDEHGRVEIH